MINKDVYLYELDISSNGTPIFGSKSFHFLFNYLLLADHVYIQASAPLKRLDVFNLYKQFKYCFQFGDINKEPLASLVLSPEIYSYSEYIEKRIIILSTGASKYLNSNKEYLSYKKSNAMSNARSLDNELPLGFVKRRVKSADKLFRKNVIRLFENESFLRSMSIDRHCQSIVTNLAKQLELFQTFNVMTLLGKKFRVAQNYKIAGAIRKMYHLANMEAVQAATSFTDIHFDQHNILTFFDSIGINTILSEYSNIDDQLVFKIRKHESFQYLKNIYFQTTNRESISSLCGIINHCYFPYYFDKILNLLLVPGFIGFCFDPSSVVLKQLAFYTSCISIVNFYTRIPVEIIKKIFETTIGNIVNHDHIKVAFHKKQLINDIKQIKSR